MRSFTWNRFPIKTLPLIPCLFHLWCEVTSTVFRLRLWSIWRPGKSRFQRWTTKHVHRNCYATMKQCYVSFLTRVGKKDTHAQLINQTGRPVDVVQTLAQSWIRIRFDAVRVKVLQLQLVPFPAYLSILPGSGATLQPIARVAYQLSTHKFRLSRRWCIINSLYHPQS